MDQFQTPNRLNAQKDKVNTKYKQNSSPFCMLPNQTTPPSRFLKIKNPFKAALDEHLHKHIFSPSVFQNVNTPKSSEKFKWSIDDVAELKPANIDVDTISEFEQSSSEDDVEIQAKIERYFSETHVVESPMTQEGTHPPLLVGNSPLAKIVEEKESNTVWTQTVLSLPPKLPEALEKALLPYFTFTDDQKRQSVDLNSSLCRRLFHFESEPEKDFSEDSIHSEISEIGSPFNEVQDSDKRKRTYDTSPEIVVLSPQDLSPIPSSTPRKLSNCPISPITINLSNVQCRNGAESDSLSPLGVKLTGQRLNLSKSSSGHMSVDNSFNMAPENEFNVGDQTNLSDSPLLQMDSSCNWDLENNSVSILGRSSRRTLFETRTETKNEEKMDISNLQTPKSKILNSQRKNLSNSFKFESLSDDETFFDFEKDRKLRKFFHEVSKMEENSHTSQNSQDVGYGSELSQNSQENIFASTPSKICFENFETMK